MELKLISSKFVIFQHGGIYSSSSSSFRHVVRVRFSPQLCSCRGLLSRVSENVYLSKKAMGSSDQENLVKEDFVYRINEVNGASSSIFSRSLRVLDFFTDEYDGVVVDPKRLPADPNAFVSILRFSITHWTMMKKKGIWLKLPLENAELVPIAVKEGFKYHHAEPGYVMLTYWIPDGPCMLPGNATHQVGIGGFVINDDNEVLVVQEKYCKPSLAGLWKLPTGFITESEEIFKGAVREVKEETGVDTEFVEVIAFRHAHNVAFEKSDLFFICMLKPLTTEIKVDDLEIKGSKWMPLTEFIEQPLMQGDGMFKKVIDICIARLRNCYCGLYPHQLISTFDGQTSSLYYNDSHSHNINCIGN